MKTLPGISRVFGDPRIPVCKDRASGRNPIRAAQAEIARCGKPYMPATGRNVRQVPRHVDKT